MMIVSDLVILHAEDATQWVVCVTESLERSVTIHSECVEKLEFPLRPSRIQNFTKARVVLMIISPRFLDFLEHHAEDALSVGRLVQSVSTVALLCGVDESSVCCFHKAALLSYENWPRFVCRGCDRRPITQLTVKLQQLLLNSEEDKLVEKNDAKLFMVPDRVSEENCCIFLILTQLVGDMEKTHVLLQRHIIKEVVVTKVNPYVVYFTVPDEFLGCPGLVNVHVRCESKLIAVKQLQCEVSRFQRSDWSSENNSPGTPEKEIFQARKLPDVDKLSYVTVTRRKRCSSEDEFPSLLGLCSRYGFQELTPQLLENLGSCHTSRIRNGLIITENEVNDVEESTEKTLIWKPETNMGKRRNSASFPSVADDGIPSKEAANHCNDELCIVPLRHSASMPSLISPDQEKEIAEIHFHEDDDVCYLSMDNPLMKKNEDPKPHERLLQQEFCKHDDYESLNSILGSHVYVSMKQRFDELNNSDHLNSSQKELAELLNTFKRGIKTISEVEQMFQDWNLRHRDSVETREEQLGVLKDKYEEANKRNSFTFTNIKSLLIRKSAKKGRKGKKEESSEKKCFLEKPKDQRMERYRRSCSTSSTSSGGSTASEKYMIGGNHDRTSESENPSDGSDDKKRKISGLLSRPPRESCFHKLLSNQIFVLPAMTFNVTEISVADGKIYSADEAKEKEAEESPCARNRPPCQQLTQPPSIKPSDTPPTPPSRPPPIHNLEQFVEQSTKRKGSKKGKNKSSSAPTFFVKARDPSPDYIYPDRHGITPTVQSKGPKEEEKMCACSIDDSNEATYLSLMPPPTPKEQLRKQSAPPTLRYIPNTPPALEPVSSEITSPKPTPRQRQKVHHSYNNVALMPPKRRTASNSTLQVSSSTLVTVRQPLFETLRNPAQTNDAVRIHSIPHEPPPSPPSS